MTGKAKLTKKLIQRAKKVAEQNSVMQALLSKAFTERYGMTYSDANCDPLIDTFDYGANDAINTVSDCDREMELVMRRPRDFL